MTQASKGVIYVLSFLMCRWQCLPGHSSEPSAGAVGPPQHQPRAGWCHTLAKRNSVSSQHIADMNCGLGLAAGTVTDHSNCMMQRCFLTMYWLLLLPHSPQACSKRLNPYSAVNSGQMRSSCCHWHSSTCPASATQRQSTQTPTTRPTQTR
jgi:hypothetical protein